MKFCSACGASVDYKVPEDDSRERAVCSNCGAIHYQNPKVVTGTLPIWGDQVLLCKRAIEPRRGYWTLPAGYMENLAHKKNLSLKATFKSLQPDNLSV